MTELWLMFSAAFLAATLLPGGSEILLVALLNDDSSNWLALVILASVGNTLGSITSYYLGTLGRFARSPEEMAKGKYKRSIALIEKYGYWALLLAWTPIIGDLLCLLAGWMKLPLLRSTLMILIGKSVRYFLVAAFALHWL
ncbi:DedA family protein [Shewanella psychropiezotolerans]|uniref:DedA family protein n=1 Tax=Shewanella psychropiezotolerans TaxID=2593655 RepID=A0ABX5WVJ9_9GAMM|nr:YqaA family protein [Shewanella psychropiezotolerans]QDO83130.1 DedA family protein [Shewanella psychropiezotolerans]